VKYAVLVLYAVAVIAMLALTARKSLSFNDFLLGGRSIGAWMSALSFGTTYFSAVIIVGYAGSMGYNYGISAVWAGIGNALIGSLLAWLLLARPVRRMGEKLNVGTLPSFFEARYKSRGMRLFAALIIFVFLIPYSASVYKGLGIMFQMALGIDYTWAVIGIAMLASLYLFAGGYRATAIVDFFQGIIMVVGIVLVVGYIVGAAGGIKAGLEALGAQGGYNKLLPSDSKIVPLFTNVLLTSVGVLGLPQMIHKFFAIKDTKAIKRATVIATVFCLIIAGGAYFAGGFSRVILDKIPAAETAVLHDANGKIILDRIMPTILTNASVVGIPDALQGLFIVLLLSASISTLTALVLTSASVISHDLVGLLTKDKKKQESVPLMRVLCVVFVILSLAINFLMQNTPIMQLMSLSWGTIAGAFLAPFLYGLLWRGTTKAGAWAGLICGALIGMLPPILLGISNAPLSGVIAMFSGLVIVPLISRLTPRTALEPQYLKTLFTEAGNPSK
jgi:solute:Na+ symporter, SSS family